LPKRSGRGTKTHKQPQETMTAARPKSCSGEIFPSVFIESYAKWKKRLHEEDLERKSGQIMGKREFKRKLAREIRKKEDENGGGDSSLENRLRKKGQKKL